MKYKNKNSQNFGLHRQTLAIISHEILFFFGRINGQQLGNSTSRIELRLAAKTKSIAIIGKLNFCHGHNLVITSHIICSIYKIEVSLIFIIFPPRRST